ncbi:MAG: PDZ domain-containing protein, partial [Chloroflexi bacterium]|nr:PDZ domain-containing protein [Chloroflexota bacterium]
TPDIATANNLGAQWGAYITQVSNGTPAAQAGLRPGDIITAIGGDQIDRENSFTLVLLKHSPGETVKVTFMRGSQVSTTDVTWVHL